MLGESQGHSADTIIIVIITISHETHDVITSSTVTVVVVVEVYLCFMLHPSTLETVVVLFLFI
jgi:hypothetical protein